MRPRFGTKRARSKNLIALHTVFRGASVQFRQIRLNTHHGLRGAACPGSPSPGWRAPFCGRVFRVVQVKTEAMAQWQSVRRSREVRGSIPFSFSIRLAQW